MRYNVFCFLYARIVFLLNSINNSATYSICKPKLSFLKLKNISIHSLYKINNYYKEGQIISGLTTIYDITATDSIKVNIIKRASKNFSLKTKIN